MLKYTMTFCTSNFQGCYKSTQPEISENHQTHQMHVFFRSYFPFDIPGEQLGAWPDRCRVPGVFPWCNAALLALSIPWSQTGRYLN